MMDLTHDHAEALRACVAAGAAGVPLGDGIFLGAALHLANHGLVTITNAKTPPQRAVVTERGRAFGYRSAA